MRRPADILALATSRCADRTRASCERGADELEMLEFTAWPRQANSHFACQVALTGALDGLAVGLPVSQH